MTGFRCFKHFKCFPVHHCGSIQLTLAWRSRSRSFSVKSDQDEKRFHLITTPIFYVNAAPHIGHLYCALLADASARWHRIKGRKTLFTTGTDEHGLKIQQAASSAKVDPLTFCDDVSLKFKNLFEKSGIRHNRFIRTTEPDHVKSVQAFWTRLEMRGHIYKGIYSGWYSISDEAFLTDDEVEDKMQPDGSIIQVSKESGHCVQWMEESNYNFRLSNLAADLDHWLKSDPIQPRSFQPSVRRMIHNLPDLSVSRDRSRLKWGIPVPHDPSQTIYVWLDALTNYLTVTGYPDSTPQPPHTGYPDSTPQPPHTGYPDSTPQPPHTGYPDTTPQPSPWPPHAHIIGKDILKFHAIYWPAFLIAAGFSPPSRIVVHSHWLVDNVKMSKSLGNVVDPGTKIHLYGREGVRYFLLKEGNLGSDGTYSDKRLVERVNSDLANTVGNLLGRCTASSVNKTQIFPALNVELLEKFLNQEECETHHRLYSIPDEVDSLYEDFHFSKGLDLIMSRCRWANSFLQSHSPWLLAKSCDSTDQSHLQTVLHVAMETLRVCGILFQPVIPEVSGKILEKLGVGEGERTVRDSKMASTKKRLLQAGKIVLYPRVK